MKIVISSGHGTKIRGASGYVDEVDEAIKIMNATADAMRKAGAEVVTYTDTVSTSQSQNLSRIVDFHNSQTRDVDISVHLNAYQSTTAPMGCEVLYLTQQQLAHDVSQAIANAAKFINRGGKKRTDLAFLNGCEEPSILLECFFCDSAADTDLYAKHFKAMCEAIAETVVGEEITSGPPRPERPPAPPLEQPPPTVGAGDRGASVEWVQTYLDVLPVDGEFGAKTERAVESYQERKGLSVDGVVGPATWAELNEDYDLPVYPPPPLEPLRAAVVSDICDAALASEVASYYWSERGAAPSGYIQGMAFAYAVMLRKLYAGDPVAQTIAQKDRGDPAHDVLSWYAEQFKDLRMDNSKDGVDTLRHLFAFMIGMGMRESSGRYCEGRDLSADNVQAETCEAGLFQTSYNASACSSDVDRLMDEYTAMGRVQQSGIDLFDDDVSCSTSEWQSYGSGVGYEFQELCKNAPQFAVESTALVLRYLRAHYGPVNRVEVELRKEADLLLQDIEAIVFVEEV
jgi:hypothetical protein